MISALDKGVNFKPVAFIDDNQDFEDRTISGRKIYHSKRVQGLVRSGRVEQILLAIPSVSERKRKVIIANLEKLGVPVLTMPAIEDLASGKKRIQDVRDVSVDDLLGREVIIPDNQLLYRCVKNQTVLVTGAGGSIGSELCRQICRLECKSLILFEQSEYNLYQIDRELHQLIENLQLNMELVSVLGSVNDPSRLQDIMAVYQVDTVYHAAAYKHVPIVEKNIAQGVRNNILGTIYTAQAAMVSNVKNFVLISTDKAVRPSNIMGATKRMAELVLQAFSAIDEVPLFQSELFGHQNKVINKTRFTMVRFGNVLGSSGSVIPLFKQQIASGGPVTVTHPKINRYFMTIPEAAQLVVQAGSMGEGGDVFVLDMGDPVNIVDLAKRMIRLSGHTFRDKNHPNGDIDIEFTGLRPGEKLYEELLLGDNVHNTLHPQIFAATEEMLVWDDLVVGILKVLDSMHRHDYDVTRTLLAQYATGFKPNSDLEDFLFRTNDLKISNSIETNVSEEIHLEKLCRIN